MSRIHGNTPKSIQRLAEVDNLIIKQKYYGKVLPADEYKINIGVDNTITLTSSNEGYSQNKTVNIIDDKGNILLECNRVNGKCFRNILNVYSQSGFKLGYVRKRLCKCKTDYEICSVNQNTQFLLTFDSNASEFTINITDYQRQHVVAIVVFLTRQNDIIEFHLTYVKKIAILQKTLILCAAILCCEQEYKAQKTTHERSSGYSLIERCCPLFKESKIKFTILSVLFPTIIVIYLMGVLMFVVAFLSSPVILILYIYKPQDRGYCEIVFVWPCILCGLFEIYRLYK